MTDPAFCSYPNGRVLVFAKAPLAGRVKTRLAAGIGDRAAVALYTGLVQDTVAMAVQAALAPVSLYVDVAHPVFDTLGDAHDIDIAIQQGADLGMRMYNAMQHALEQADFVVLIGSDCPVMHTDYLAQACHALHSGTTFVFGPAEDGGYVLAGARIAEERLFTGMRWSTTQLMQHTRARLRQLDRPHTELDTLWDLDTPEDLERWQTLTRSAVTG